MPSAWGKAWGSAWGAAWGAIDKAKGDGAAGHARAGMVRQRRPLPDAVLFLPPQPDTLPDLAPIAPPKPTSAAVYKQNQPVAPAGSAQAATDFLSNLLANLPALQTEDASTPSASDASAPLGGTQADTPPAQPVMGQGSGGGSRTQQVAAIDGAASVGVGASAGAQRAARDDEALALIMILLESA